MKSRFVELFHKPISESGYNKPAEEFSKRVAVHLGSHPEAHHSVLGGGAQATETAPVPAKSGTNGAVTSDKNTAAFTEIEMMNNRPTPDRVEKEPDKGLTKGALDLGHGDVPIAAITSCTNTSNPSVMIAAGLPARQAVERR